MKNISEEYTLANAKHNSQNDQVYDLSKLIDIISLFKDETDEERIKLHVSRHLASLVAGAGLSGYRVIFLYDDWHKLSPYHANKIYKAVFDLNQQSDILLILQSGDGCFEPAYLISKMCKRQCKNKFVVSIPRRAKSAATLLSLGATEIHMGLLSELGPIMPFYEGFSATGLENSMEVIADITSAYPATSEMFAKNFNLNFNLKELGDSKRNSNSATQYARRLLSGKSFPNNWDEKKIASHLSTSYSDPAFVIDAEEAMSLFGPNVVKEQSREYALGNQIYEFLDFFDFACGMLRNKRIRYVGSISNGLDMFVP